MKTSRLASIIWIICGVIISLSGCRKDFNGYYDPPSSLKGPVYEQLKSDPDYSEFVKAIDKFPRLAQAINTSGLYTVFAPTNDAIKTFLTAKFPGKSSIADFNMSVVADSLALNELVQMHIVFNMYFEYDFNHAIDMLSKPNPLGAINSSDIYRYTTRYKDSRYTYYDKKYKRTRIIALDYKKVTVYSRNYIDKYDLSADYQSFFGTAPSDFNIDWAQIVPGKKDIAAKNGVIHGINKVLEKFPYISELAENKNPAFYNLLGQFVTLNFSSTDPISRDSLYTKLYFGLPLESDDRDFTFLCPNDNSFVDFVNNQVLPGFDHNYDSIHPFTSNLLLSSYYVVSFSNSTNIRKQALDWNGDTLRNLDIKDMFRASNGILYTVGSALYSPAFNSVAKVALLNKKYSWFVNLLTTRVANGSLNSFYYANIDYLKNQNRSFTLIIPSNSAFMDAGITWTKDYKGTFDFFQAGSRLLQSQKDSILNSLIIPNISVSPSDMTYKWCATRGDNFMLFKNGRIQSTVDYLTDELTGNGYAYTTEVLPPRPSSPLSSVIGGRTGYSIFVDSILNVQTWNGSQTFMNLLKTVDGINSFTVLMPSDALLTQFKTDNARGAFSKDTIWRNIAAYHILTTKVFGDGAFLRKPGNPLSTDDTKFVTLYDKDIYNSIFIKDIYAWVQTNFNGQKTITSEDGEQTHIIKPFDIQAANGVVHAVDKILMPPARHYH